jgi:hypothetical protein
MSERRNGAQSVRMRIYFEHGVEPQPPKRCESLDRHRSVATRSAPAPGTIAILSLIDLERAAIEVGAVQCLHGTRCVGIRHLDEAEATRPTGVAIRDERNLLDRSMGREQRAHGVFCGGERQIADVKLGHCRVLALKV